MIIAIDVETTMKPFFLPWQKEAQLVMVSIYTSTRDRLTWWFNHPVATQTPRDCIQEINEIVQSADRVVAHNMKFDYQWLTHIGVELDKRKLFCTMVAEYLIRGHQRMDGLALDDLCEFYSIPKKKDKVKIYWDAGVETYDIPAEILQPYCEQDCVNALALFKRQWPTLQRLGLSTVFALEMQALKAYAEMEKNGMLLDTDLLKKHEDEFTKDLNLIDCRLCDLLGIENINSNAQLSVGLFGGEIEEDGYAPLVDEEGNEIRFKSGDRKGEIRYQKITKKKKLEGIGFRPEQFGIAETKNPGIYETNVTALKSLKPKTETQKEVVRLLFERSRMSQMLKTYFTGLLNIQVDKYVHPTLNQALTKTGRTSCKRPNLQNQPRGNTGPVKECFITRY